MRPLPPDLFAATLNLHRAIASLQHDRATLRLIFAVQKFSQNQPRISAGHPEGGQWAAVGSKPQAQDISTAVSSSAGVADDEALLDAGLNFYGVWTTRNGPDSQAIITLAANDGLPVGPPLNLEYVGSLTPEQLFVTCPKF